MLSTIGVYMLLAAGALLVVGLMLAYVWKLPTIIAELNGKTSQKTIRKLKKLNNSEEMSNTEFYQQLASGTGTLNTYKDSNDGSYNDGAPSTADLQEILERVADEPKVGTGRRRKKQFVEEEEYAPSSGHIGLSTDLLGGRQEVQSVIVTPEIDYSVDASTGLFDESEKDSQDELPMDIFSESRTVLVTHEISSLDK